MCSREALARLVDVQRHGRAGRPPAGTRCPSRRGAGSTRRPIVARNGFDSACRTSTASPVRERPLDADRRRLAERRRRGRSRSPASPGSPPSAPRRRARPRARRRASSWRTLISGSCSASCASATRSRARSSGSRGTTTDSSVGGGNWWRALAPLPSPIASPIWTSRETPELSDLARGDGRRCTAGPRSKTAIAVTLPSSVAAEAQPVARADRAREHPDVGDLLAGRRRARS